MHRGDLVAFFDITNQIIRAVACRQDDRHVRVRQFLPIQLDVNELVHVRVVDIQGEHECEAATAATPQHVPDSVDHLHQTNGTRGMSSCALNLCTSWSNWTRVNANSTASAGYDDGVG